MGLDMYAYTAPVEMVANAQVDLKDRLFADGKPLEGVNTDFWYWRKFNHLHGWMEKLYRDKLGTSEDFNCDTVRLMEEDFDQLEADINKGNLKHRPGFFFGGADMHEDDLASVRMFIEDGRKALADGLAVIYDSWW